MKRIAIFLAIGAALAGCTSTEATQQAVKVTAAVKQVQAYTKQACGYLPIASTIIGIFNAGVGATISGVGGAICEAVTTVPLADGPGDHKPRVNGVVVRGKFVR